MSLHHSTFAFKVIGDDEHKVLCVSMHDDFQMANTALDVTAFGASFNDELLAFLNGQFSTSLTELLQEMKRQEDLLGDLEVEAENKLSGFYDDARNFVSHVLKRFER